MKIKKVIGSVLGVFVAFSVCYLVYSEIIKSKTMPVPAVLIQKTVNAENKKVVQGLYFHGRNRCYTCNLMEGYIRDVIKESFSKEQSEGRLTFNNYNVDETSNNHFIQDYQLSSISFFLSLKEGEKELRFSNVDKIWQLAKDEAAFKLYIKTEIKKYLEM